jgi:hypothetical protein
MRSRAADDVMKRTDVDESTQRVFEKSSVGAKSGWYGLRSTAALSFVLKCANVTWLADSVAAPTTGELRTLSHGSTHGSHARQHGWPKPVGQSRAAQSFGELE